jgi:hypothetical protein
MLVSRGIGQGLAAGGSQGGRELRNDCRDNPKTPSQAWRIRGAGQFDFGDYAPYRKRGTEMSLVPFYLNSFGSAAIQLCRMYA